MKDKELRGLLKEARIINEYGGEYGNYYVPVCIGEKIDAIAKHLGLEFKRVPEKLIAVSKVAPQSTIEAANTSANSTK